MYCLCFHISVQRSCYTRQNTRRPIVWLMKRCFFYSSVSIEHLSLCEASCKRIVAWLALCGQMWLWHACLKNHPNKQTSPRLQCFRNHFGLLNNQRADESHGFNQIKQSCNKRTTKLPNVYSLLDLFTRSKRITEFWLMFFMSLNKNRWPNFPLQASVGMLVTGMGGNSILWLRLPVHQNLNVKAGNVHRSTDR